MKREGRDALSVTRLTVIGLLLAASLGGCKKKDANGSADTVSAAAQPAPAAAPSSDEGVPLAFHGVPGAPATSTATYVSNLDFSTGNAADYIHDDLPCDADDDVGCTQNGGKKTRRIVGIPERHAQKVDWNAILQPDHADSGYVVLKLTNQGAKSKRWHLDHGESAYLWVGPDAAGNKVVALYKIDLTSGYATQILTAKVARKCDEYAADPQHPNRRNAHIFPNENGHCGISESVNHMRVLYERPHLKYQERIPSGAGLWVSCSNGCCEATYLES